jgi:hypothetical protein
MKQPAQTALRVPSGRLRSYRSGRLVVRAEAPDPCTSSVIALPFAFHGGRRRDVPCGFCLGTVDSEVEKVRIDLRLAVKSKKHGLIDFVEQLVRFDEKAPQKSDAFVENRLDKYIGGSPSSIGTSNGFVVMRIISLSEWAVILLRMSISLSCSACLSFESFRLAIFIVSGGTPRRDSEKGRPQAITKVVS